MDTVKRRTNSRIVTSIILWLKYAGLFFTTFTATISCVFMFWHFTTCPNVPWPRTSKIKYLRNKEHQHCHIRTQCSVRNGAKRWSARTYLNLCRASRWHRECNHSLHCQIHHYGTACSAWWERDEGYLQTRIGTVDCIYGMCPLCSLWAVEVATKIVKVQSISGVPKLESYAPKGTVH